MSYILDALKKSEQKRKQGAVPDLSTIHDGVPPKTGKRAWWRSVLIGILFLALGVVLERTQVVTRKETPVQAPLQIPAQISPQTPTPIRQQAKQPDKKKPPKTVQTASRKTDSAPVDAPAPAAGTPLSGEQPSSKQVLLKERELPPAIQQELPDLTISTQSYDANPASRIIIVHGKIIHEGEDIAAGLRLESITPDGVILSYKGYRFYRQLL